MQRVIKIYEYEGINISEIPVELLNKLSRINRVKIEGKKLIPIGITGYMKFNDYEVIILPKIKNEDYFYMLNILGIYEFSEEKLEMTDVLYNIVKHYGETLLEVSKRIGPPLEYTSEKIEEAIVKGKINIGESINLPKLKQTRWIMGFGKISGVLIGAMIHAYRVFKTEELFYILSKLKIIFSEAKPIFKPQYQLTPPDEYASLFRLANFILDTRFMVLPNGLFIDNFKLFEQFIYKILYKNYFTIYQQEVKLDKINIRPDFMINGIPVDAKYKFSIENPDIYQAFTYASVFGKNLCILIYPYLEYEININNIKIKAISIFQNIDKNDLLGILA
ncbi:MAG: McrC family protein [candidate division WOR-3 bacterium]|nr:McrC family protein [candidate division WOR-3 bacterium]MCX7948196.1 McrC family protein [candidate division WOR-3 bacterium]MDW8151107.1 hypothetical protein [candidate division WOR-3 bacterium]